MRQANFSRLFIGMETLKNGVISWKQRNCRLNGRTMSVAKRYNALVLSVRTVVVIAKIVQRKLNCYRQTIFVFMVHIEKVEIKYVKHIC